MKLEEIGFYTLSDQRAKTTSPTSDLQRGELIVTTRCNFNCPYCRKLDNEEDISFSQAIKTINIWAQGNLQNIRFSGGEPTLYKHLPLLIEFCKGQKIKRIAISTNGSNNLEYYKKLVERGVNDFSISLDSCCSSGCDKNSGVKGHFETICNNIRELSKLTYVTVGIVINQNNIEELNNILSLASDLGVHDIRIIPSSQFNKSPDNIPFCHNYDNINKYPILKYRYYNIFNRFPPFRGLTIGDNTKCPLVLDDIVIYNNNHYPCIIYMREQGKPIGKINNLNQIRNERFEWYNNHNCYNDPICNKNCLDVCIDYNNKVKEFQPNL